MDVNGKERPIDRYKPRRDRMYLTHVAKLGQHRGNGGIQFHGGDQLLPTGLELTLGANWTGVGATGDGAVVLDLTERVELREGPPRGLGGPQVEHKFTHGSGGYGYV